MSDMKVETLNCNNCDGELNLSNYSRDNTSTTVICEYCNSVNLIISDNVELNYTGQYNWMLGINNYLDGYNKQKKDYL